MSPLFHKKRLEALRGSRVGQYLQYAIGEIILVVIGILIALNINNSSEKRKNRSLEAIYLQEMREDFAQNLETSELTLDWIDFIIPRLIILMEQAHLPEPEIPLDSLNFYFSLCQEMPTYISTDRVYNNLTGSGDFRIIGSAELKNELAHYQQSVNLIKLVQNTHELELVSSFQPYIIQNLDYQALQGQIFDEWDIPEPLDSSRIIDKLKDLELRNILSLKLQILSDLRAQNKSLKAVNESVLSILDQEIGP